MRPPAPLNPVIAWLQRRPRWQSLLFFAAIGIYLVWRMLHTTATILLDRWWYDSVTDAPIWSTMTLAKLELMAGAGAITIALIGSTVWMVLRSKPASTKPLALPIRRYHERVGPAHRWLLIGIVVYLTWRISSTAMGYWPQWLLFLHGPDLGRDAPEIGGDLGYHLFRLPFLAIVSGWLRPLVGVAFVIAAIGHVMAGAIRLPGRGRKSSPAAFAHLALLAALYAGLQALHYVLIRRPALATSRAGPFDGPGYTQLHLTAPALLVLGAVALAVGFLLVNGARTDRWRLPLVVLLLWGILHVGLLHVAPGYVTEYVVKPAEAEKELPYIAENLTATREAYRLDAVEQQTITLDDGIDKAPDAKTDPLTGIPVFSTGQLESALQVLQGTTATQINDVDLDRYKIDGKVQPVLIATRNASRGDLPESGWVQRNLVYTHGNGAVRLPADRARADGRPDADAFVSDLALDRPELYFGNGLANWYAVVGTKRQEQGGTRFAADTGIPIGSPWRRLVLSLSTGDIEPLVSSELTSESQVLYRRDVRHRLKALAPFLAYDSNPYPVISDGHIVWVVDAYTTSARYPYGQFAAGHGGVSSKSGLASRRFNYAHASVKATVDAYDGSVHLYRTEVGGARDPILDAWEGIFPGLIEPIDHMPKDITKHLRYPTDLLTLHARLLGRYHVNDPELLFNGTERWTVSPAVPGGVGKPSNGVSAPTSIIMPGDDRDAGDWVALLPFSPGSSSNANAIRHLLSGLAIANHDDPERLRLITVEPSSERFVASPLVAQSAIDADPHLARLFTLLNANGSIVEFGPMTPLLYDDGLVWLRPIIVTGTAETTTPRLYGVVAVSNGLVGFGDDVRTAVANAVKAAIDDDAGTSGALEEGRVGTGTPADQPAASTDTATPSH